MKLKKMLNTVKKRKEKVQIKHDDNAIFSLEKHVELTDFSLQIQELFLIQISLLTALNKVLVFQPPSL